MPIYNGPGAWGPGEGMPLTQPQFDGNTWEWRQAIDALVANPPAANGIASITVAGTAMTITLEDSQELGPYPLPVLMFRWRGAWAALSLHAPLDSFMVSGSGIFVSLRDHMTAATFDPDAVGAAVTAGAFVAGTLYRIATVGTTDFVPIGASANTVGVDFTATGAGTGTGTAAPKTYNQLIGIGTNTALDDLIDVDVTGAAANAMLVAVATGSPPVITWEDRTPVQVTALLSDFVGDTGSPGVGGVRGLVPAPADGDEAADKFLHAGGGWEPVPALSDFVGDTGSPGGGVAGLVPAPADGDAAADKFLQAGGGWEIVTSGINQLTGDVTAGPGTGSQAATLANTAVTPGSYTLMSGTVDAKGRLIEAATGTGDAISDLPPATLPVPGATLIELSVPTGSPIGSPPSAYESQRAEVDELLASVIAATGVPASAGANGTVGQISWDASFIYVCSATNTWKRVAIATW